MQCALCRAAALAACACAPAAADGRRRWLIRSNWRTCADVARLFQAAAFAADVHVHTDATGVAPLAHLRARQAVPARAADTATGGLALRPPETATADRKRAVCRGGTPAAVAWGPPAAEGRPGRCWPFPLPGPISVLPQGPYRPVRGVPPVERARGRRAAPTPPTAAAAPGRPPAAPTRRATLPHAARRPVHTRAEMQTRHGGAGTCPHAAVAVCAPAGAPPRGASVAPPFLAVPADGGPPPPQPADRWWLQHGALWRTCPPRHPPTSGVDAGGYCRNGRGGGWGGVGGAPSGPARPPREGGGAGGAASNRTVQ